MTGFLAALGIVIVLTASAYVGLADDDTTGGNGASGDDESDIQRVVITVTPTPTTEPEQGDATPGPTASPTPTLNREDCDEIRGTDYRSPGEREWFLDNCVNN